MRQFVRVTLTLFLCGLAVLTGCQTDNSTVTLDSLSIVPLQPAPGQAVIISTLVHNTGKKNVDYPVNIVINGQTVETLQLTLAGGESRTFEYSYTPEKTGQYQIEINGQPAAFSALRPADFQVDSLKISPESPVAGEEVTAEAEVRNFGDLTGTFTERFRIDGIDNETLEKEISPGETAGLSWHAVFSTSGTHTLELGGCQCEFRVRKPAEFQVTSISVTPTRVLTGDPAVVEALITNIGEAADSRPVGLRVEGIEDQTQILDLEAGSSATIRFEVTFNEIGFYDLAVQEAECRVGVINLPEYNSLKYGYQASYPTGARVVENDPETVAMETDEGGLAVLVDRVPLPSTAEDYFNGIAQGKRSQLPDWSYRNLTEIVEDGRTTGYQFDYSNTVDGALWQGRGMVLKQGGLGFYVVYTALEAQWQEHLRLAERCLAEFTLPVIGTGQFYDPELHLGLTLPADWSLIKPVRKQVDQPDLILLCPTAYSAPASAGIVIKAVPAGTTAESYFKEGLEAGLMLGLIDVHFKGAFQFDSGETGYELIDALAIEEFDLKSITINLVKDGKCYLVDFYGTAAEIDRLQKPVEQLARTLTVD